jgi:outer membrane protein assembly factor BamB
LDGAIYAQPLVVGAAVIVATENDTVYSLSTSTGTVNWSRHLGTPVRGSELPCGDIDPSGITGTPVADLASKAVWVVTFSTPAAHTLWEVSLRTGDVLGSRPADPPGADPRAEQQRGALALGSGRVYIPYGGLYGDCGDFHGWLVGLSDTTGPVRTSVTYVTQAERAGIWAPPGPVVDTAGDLLIATGNGLPANVPGDANSVIRLDPSLHVVARFTAPDYQSLSENDTDLGSVSPSIVAGGNVLQVGKEGVGYLLPPNLSSPLQTFHVCGGAFGGTAVDGDYVYIACFDGLYALGVSANGRASIRWAVRGIRPGPPIIAGGMVWTVDRGGSLRGYSQADGSSKFANPVSVAGSFPSLSASGGALFVQDGNRIMSFAGV